MKLSTNIHQLSLLLVCFIINLDISLAQSSVCFCVTSGYCTSNPTVAPNDGSNQIDIRIVNAASTLPPMPNPGYIVPVSSGITPSISQYNSCQQGLSVCCLPSYQCGIRYPPVANGPSPAPDTNQAAFGAYPWQAVILLSADSSFVGSGVLIDNFHILTVAHKVSNYANNPQVLKVRLGEWDASSVIEPIQAQEYQVQRVFINPAYNSANLRNSIAILRLTNAVPLGLTPTITYACLPSAQISGQRCHVAGWGVSNFNTGSYQTIQREVDLPLVDQTTCQNQLRATRLGSTFQLDFNSFICAGGEFGKDACTGDGGSPLVCKIGNNWYVAGLVAWGIGCATQNVPGVYINVVSYINWIQQTTRTP
ncbi:unnamed protein product [Chironomus riparius]|uniref:Peptidase S1 domain-containing protein n=1 Tax=Chironomus riparius TaxID=315576 RepID=A0A9N9S640_9DIPT|nr:unnamed protein product [Chironomus riparius]